MRRLLAPILVLAALVAFSVLSDHPDPRADFTFINRGDVTTLDLQRMSWMQDLRVARLVYEGLVRNDVFADGYAVQPAVAERWEISPDGRTYRFYLRADAKWSNGQPVTADDFVYSWRRAMLPDTISDYAAQFLLIKGAREFYDWRTAQLAAIPAQPDLAPGLWDQTERKCAELVAMRSLDHGRIFEFELERPTPYFLDLCAFAVFYPVYPPLVRQYERADPTTGRLEIQTGWTKPGTIVSNGPFTLERWRFKRDLRLKKNPLYWNRDALAIDSIAIPSVEDANAAVLAFESGQVDWVSDVIPPYRRDMYQAKLRFYDEARAAHAKWIADGRPPNPPMPPDIDALIAARTDPIAIDNRLPDDKRKNVHVFPAFGTYFLNFNCNPKLNDGRDNPFHDPRVRRAFALCVDKERVARDIRGIGERPLNVLIPPGSLTGYASPAGLSRDPDLARRLLAEAGYPEGKGFPPVEYLVNKDGGHDVIAQAVAKDWQDQLAVPVSIVVREIKVFRNDLKQQNFMISRGSWFGDYGDPTTFLELNRTGDGNNDRHYSSSKYDALLTAADQEPDRAKRYDLLAQAERTVVEEDLPLIPIFQYSQMYLFDPDEITGISAHPRQVQNLYLIDRLHDGKGPGTLKTLHD